jgi:hypothetical protein
VATQTIAELAPVGQRDPLRQVLEWVSAAIIFGGPLVYLSSVFTSGMLVGVALLVFLVLSGAYRWSVARGLARAMFAAPVDYAKELAERNAGAIRRVSRIWPLFAAIALAVLVALDLVLGGSGDRPSTLLAIAVVTAACVALAVGFSWRRRERARLVLEWSTISELRQTLSSEG